MKTPSRSMSRPVLGLLALCLAAPAVSAPGVAAPPPPALDASRGKEVGLSFEAFLSPMQEPAEESETPKTTPSQFKSTAPSQTRAEREAAGHRAHGVLRFSKDLSRAWVDVKVEGVNPADINMFHIHCGEPGVLGPILVDLSTVADLQKELADGVFSGEIRNEHILTAPAHGHGGLVAEFTSGCLIPSLTLDGGVPPKISTIGGVADIAAEGDLYFNLHTKGQTFYGDMRGQILPAR